MGVASEDGVWETYDVGRKAIIFRSNPLQCVPRGTYSNRSRLLLCQLIQSGCPDLMRVSIIYCAILYLVIPME